LPRPSHPRARLADAGTTILGHIWPKDVESQLSFSGLLLAGMQTELIELENETASAVENTRPRSEGLPLAPIKKVEILTPKSSERLTSEFARSHEYSPLND
jgi:hypothetical protein